MARRSTCTAFQRYTTETGWTNLPTYTKFTSYPDSGLTNGSTYSFRIAAHNGAGWGPYSAVVNAVPYTTPGAPGSLVANSGLDVGSVNLNWFTPSNGGSAIDGYEVGLATSAGGPWVNTWSGTSSTSYEFTGLIPGSTYYFHVLAHNAAGWSAPSAVVKFTVAPTVPSTPKACSGFQSPGAGSHYAYLDWDASTSDGAADHQLPHPGIGLVATSATTSTRWAPSPTST